MKVKLVAHTIHFGEPNDYDAESLIRLASRVCHGKENKKDTIEDCLHFIDKYVFGKEHLSLLEHFSFTFLITGVSRVLTHQLMRHRIATYHQKSQRYTNENNFDYVTPPSIALGDQNLKVLYDGTMEYLRGVYNKLREEGVPQEDARFVLPGATESTILCTWNLRSFHHILKLRLHKSAQWEIRELLEAIVTCIRDEGIMTDHFLHKLGGNE